jgi:hypothetical protein
MPIAGVVFHSCCGCNEETQHENYSHQTIFLKNLDNSGKEAIESEALQLNKNAYGIRLYLEREKVVIAYEKKQINSIFIQSAYATSCECPPEFLYFANDSIVSIKIFTVNDFDNLHLENSNITDYFKVAGSFSSIENYVKNLYYTYAEDFEYWGRELKLDLLLMTAPTANNKQQFEVQVTLSDGRILKQKTLEIELL